jgi:protein-S-isoprenylcysteine O-methyltransferase Ste14
MTRSREEHDTPGVIAPPPLLYLIPLIAGVLLNRWYPIAPLSPLIGRIVGVLGVACGVVVFQAVRAFRRAETNPEPWKPTTALVTTGPYRFTRNPMYLGFTCVYIGIACWLNTAWPLIFLPIILLVMARAVIAREERYLTRKFGSDYQAYMQRVRRWV